MLNIQFGAHWANKLSNNQVNDKVFAKITQWSKEDSALSVLMNDALTPDVELNVVQQGANQEYRIVATQGNRYIADLGVTPKQVQARKKSIIKSLISDLVLRTDLFKTDAPIKAIIEEMKSSKSLSQQRQVFAGALDSISPSYPVYYQRFMNCPPKHVQLPVFEIDDPIYVSLALQPLEFSTSKFRLT
ncbi:MAG: hypothetical protein K2X66_18265, partial [Cyanobacteria bacterium]|nr:hypothetical protein [Cyanobacteriota bacterium]